MNNNRYKLTSWISKVMAAALLMALSFSNSFAQTVISPTGDGGFETGTTFAANGWTAVLDANSKWYVGTFAKSAGTRGAYIDVNLTTGGANNYNSSAIRTSHFYRDFTIPAGATNIVLTFKWKAQGEDFTGADQYDFLRVYVVPTSTIPVAATLLPAANIVGAGKYNLQSAAFQTATITLPNTLAGTTQRLVFTWRNDDSVTNNPAAAVDEISLTYTPGGNCSGTPVGGTTQSSANPVCSGVSFNLSLSGATSLPGITYQWQSSPNNSTWTDIGGATLSTYSTSQTAATYYRCKLTCSTNPPGFSSALQIAMSPMANCYCVPVYTTGCAADRITSFQLNTLSNNSGATCSTSPAGYSIYGTSPSNLTTTLDQGGSYTATIATVAGNANGTGVAIWIDYNDNGTFDATERNDNGATKFTSNTTGTLIVNVPVTAPLGPHSMRVMSARNVASNALSPCTPGNANGETEDYIVTIAVPTACSGNPTAGTTQSTANPACYGGNFTLTLGGATTLAGLTYQWQSSPDNITWNSISGATNSSFTANQTVATYYQCIVTCTNSGQSATSTPLQVTVSPLETCYCVGTYDFDCSLDYISNVTFGSISNTSTCSGATPTNRTVYTPANATFYRGFSYPLSVTTDGDEEGMRAWIDYDHSFTFIAGESVLSATYGGPPQTTSATITIPATATLGKTILRVRCRYLNTVGTGQACTNFASSDYGETEDYIITIADAPSCSGTPVAGNTVSSAVYACPATPFNLSLSGNAVELGLSYQWQSAPDVNGTPGTYSPIAGATQTSYTASQAASTWYKCMVTCANGGASSASTPLLIQSAACINMTTGSTTTCAANFYDSGGPSADYAISENLIYTFYPNAGNQTRITWSSFVSEQDYDYITIYNGPSTSSPVLYGPLSGTLSIPAFTSTDPSGALTILFTSDASITAAGWSAAVSCVPNPPCSGTPAGSTTIASVNPACFNTPFNLSLGTSYLFSGITYQWQSAPDISGVPGTFSNIGGATGNMYAATQTANTWYHCIITCTNGNQSVTSANLRVTTQLCYCVPNYTTGCAADKISNFVLNTLSNNSGTACSTSPAGYSVYGTTPSNQTTILTPGTAYTSTITVVTGNANGTGVAIWIDYNDNGVFDASENNNNGATKFASNTTGTLVVNVPATAPPGQHRLRVVSARNTNSNAVGPCTPGNAAGEAEDYTITIADPVASSNSPVCEGDTLHLFAVPSGATSYTWTGPDGFTSSVQNPSIPHATTAASGLYQVSIVIGSTTYNPSTTVVVNPSPSVAASNNAPFCSGTQNLNLTSNAPTATLYQWTGPNGFSSALANPVINAASNLYNGNYKLKVTDANGCRDSAITQATIYALPAVNITIIGNQNLCIGQTTSDLQATGASSYLWNTNDNSSLITVSTAGTYSVTGTDGNGCTDSHTQVITESAPPVQPALNLSGTQTICFNASGIIPLTLSCTNYSNDLLWSSSETSPSIIIDYEDVFNVTYTDVNGCYSVSNSVVSVFDAEAPSITCPADITSCSTSPALGTPVTSDNCSVASVTNDAPSSFPLGTTDVVWTVTDYNNNSSSCIQHVTVESPSTAPSSVTSSASYGQICLGGNLTLNVGGGTLGTGALWKWYEGGCGSGSSIGTGSSITVTPATTGPHSYYVRAEGACGTSLCASLTVNVISSPPAGTIHYTSVFADGCVNAPATALTVNAVAGASYYRWTSAQAGVRFNGNPGPYETTVPTVNVTFVSLPAAGSSGWSICAFGGNACGNSNTICTWVRAIVGKPTSINGSVIGCPGSSGNTYASAPEPGASGYIWSATGGIVINNNGQQSITVDFPAGFVTGTLSVHAQTSCGYNSADRTITITRAPAIPGIISGPSYPCPNASSAFSVAPVPGAASYTWTTSVPGAMVTGTSASCSITFPAVIPAGSTVSVTANSSCPFSSAVRSKGIATGIPNIPLVINGPPAGQCGQTGVSYSISPIFNATGYTWTAACGTIVGPNNLSGVTIDWPSSFVSCSLSVSASNACGTGGARTLVVSAIPAMPPAITGTNLPCAGAVETYSTAGSAGATDYAWTVPAGATIIGGQGSNSLLMQWGSTSGNVTVRASNTCGNSSVRSLACTINCRSAQVDQSMEIAEASVYPNPASEKITLRFNSAEAEKYVLKIMDMPGQVVLEKSGASISGTNLVDMDVDVLPDGIYMLQLKCGGSEKEFKIMISR